MFRNVSRLPKANAEHLCYLERRSKIWTKPIFRHNSWQFWRATHPFECMNWWPNSVDRLWTSGWLRESNFDTNSSKSNNGVEEIPRWLIGFNYKRAKLWPNKKTLFRKSYTIEIINHKIPEAILKVRSTQNRPLFVRNFFWRFLQMKINPLHEKDISWDLFLNNNIYIT